MNGGDACGQDRKTTTFGGKCGARIGSRRLITAMLIAGAFAVVSPARADILAGPDATKICAGYQGGGISWSIGLNEGWRPSRLISYRVILRDPRHRIVDSHESYRLGGGWIGPYPYWDMGRVTSESVVGTNSLSEPTAGTYTFTLQLRVDPRYPDIGAIGQNNFDWPKHAGKWVTQSWTIRVFNC